MRAYIPNPHFLKWSRILGLLALLFLVQGSLSATERKTQNVVLITTDGLRWQEVFGGADEQLMNEEHGNVSNLEALRKAFWRDRPEARRESLLPFLWTVIAREGQLFGNIREGSSAKVTNGLNFSYPGYSEMLTGFPDARIDSNDRNPNPNMTVLEWLNRMSAYQGRVAAFCSWDVFPFIINSRRSGVLVSAGREPVPGEARTSREELLNRLVMEIPSHGESSRHDAFTFHFLMEYLRKSRPRVLYVSFDETDEWAHAGRYDRYLQAAHRVDSYIRELWIMLQSDPDYAGKTSLIITTDHGRGDAPIAWKGHGARVAGAENIWLAVLGPDTPASGERKNSPPITQSQVAATLASLLGEDYAAAVPKAAKPITSVLPGR